MPWGKTCREHILGKSQFGHANGPFCVGLSFGELICQDLGELFFPRLEAGLTLSPTALIFFRCLPKIKAVPWFHVPHKLRGREGNVREKAVETKRKGNQNKEDSK